MPFVRTYLKRGETYQAPAHQLVNTLLATLGYDPALYGVFEVWDREMSTRFKGCEAVGLNGRKLVVKIPSAVHRHELMYAKRQILAKMNQALGRELIVDIQFDYSSDSTQNKGKNRGKFDTNRE